MRRGSAVLVAGIMVLAMAACGDDGSSGDEDAFCDELEELSEDIADGDLASNDGLEDLVDRANDLIEFAADGEQTDAVQVVGEALSEADPDDAQETAELIRDELGDIADDVCNIDEDEFAIPPTTTTTTEPEPTTTTTEDEPDPDDGPTEVNGRLEIPADFEADEDIAAAQACYDGDPEACDDLYLSTGIGTVAERYGSTCGGRVAGGTRGGCAALISPPTPIPPGVEDLANAQACFDGDMAACDAQFQAADPGTADQFYGGLCGNRVQNTTAFCVEIFGDVAYQ